jgi:hypothetical protein
VGEAAEKTFLSYGNLESDLKFFVVCTKEVRLHCDNVK